MTASRPGSPTATVTSTLRIDGMTCANCVRHVRDALLALDGVANADVDLASQTASVTHRPDLVHTDELAAAVVEAGYEAAPMVR